MQRINYDAKNRELELLEHAPVDEDLVETMSAVVSVPRNYVSHFVASRDERSKTEISRILGHLPVVQEARLHREQFKRSFQQSGVGSLKPQRTPREEDPQRTPRNSMARANGLNVPGLDLERLGGTGGIGGPSRQNSTRQETPRGAALANCGAQCVQAKAPMGPMAMEFAALAKANEKRKAADEATHRVAKKLNEIGIDASGMKAEDVLKMYYARGVGTSYNHMNRDLDDKVAASPRAVVQKPAIPPTLNCILTERAQQEIKRAKELPMTEVSECLDKWEIDFLADQCRSLRHLGQKSRGYVSEMKQNVGSFHLTQSVKFK